MAMHKLNVLHWHLTDDQAWRIEIRKYPKLTQVGAWRVPAGAARNVIDPATGKPRRYGGFYTQAQIRSIVAYAKARAITIVPEIDVPGHTRAMIAAYPGLGEKGHPVAEVPADWGVFPAWAELRRGHLPVRGGRVRRSDAALFPGPFIHKGGDEIANDPFTARLPKFLAPAAEGSSDGTRSWTTSFRPSAVVMSWRGHRRRA
jgi:hexosaminidase